MISLHRSIHSSQIYTPGPAMSFLTWRWLLPQKLHSSCSEPPGVFGTSRTPYLCSRILSTIPYASASSAVMK